MDLSPRAIGNDFPYYLVRDTKEWWCGEASLEITQEEKECELVEALKEVNIPPRVAVRRRRGLRREDVDHLLRRLEAVETRLQEYDSEDEGQAIQPHPQEKEEDMEQKTSKVCFVRAKEML
eukprot:Gb_15164 [translate_table: standard]